MSDDIVTIYTVRHARDWSAGTDRFEVVSAQAKRTAKQLRIIDGGEVLFGYRTTFPRNEVFYSAAAAIEDQAVRRRSAIERMEHDLAKARRHLAQVEALVEQQEAT